jgi:hypothetical protein
MTTPSMVKLDVDQRLNTDVTPAQPPERVEARHGCS